MIHTFSGPTITHSEITALLPLAAVHGPIRHGDLFRLDVAAGDTVVIIDGLWHQTAPIRHKEILEALARGVTVIGAASAGALRAAELHPYGMHGIGRIFEAYRDGHLEADDEVAVTQDPDTAEPLTLALVNARFTFDDACAADAITPAERDTLFAIARTQPYTRRTWRTLQQGASDAGASRAWGRLHAWMPPAGLDYKYADAVQALTATAAKHGDVPGPDWMQGPWRTSFLRSWQAKFTPVAIPQTTVAAMLRHQMIYDPAFPARWRAVVLSWIAGAPQTLHDPLPAALAAADRRGLTWDALELRQKAHWLTTAEVNTLGPGEGLARILIRSARLDTAADRVWPATLPDAAELLNPAMDSARACEQARSCNAAASAAGLDPRHLRPSVVRSHLAIVWGVGEEPDMLDAAARDRAFHDMDTAVAAGRMFYLEAKPRHRAA